MTKLIIQPYGNRTEKLSPFHRAITEVTKAGPISIVCPYNDVCYLSALVDKHKSWHLLTDMEEWLGSNNREQRKNMASCYLTGPIEERILKVFLPYGCRAGIESPPKKAVFVII